MSTTTRQPPIPRRTRCGRITASCPAHINSMPKQHWRDVIGAENVAVSHGALLFCGSIGRRWWFGPMNSLDACTDSHSRAQMRPPRLDLSGAASICGMLLLRQCCACACTSAGALCVHSDSGGDGHPPSWLHSGASPGSGSADSQHALNDGERAVLTHANDGWSH